MSTAISRSIPLDQFYYAANQVQDRLNILTSLNSFVSEIAEIDNAYSRALLKIGSTLPSATVTKVETFQQVNNALENVSRILSTQRAPLISSNSQSIQQNIGKLFPDYAKNNSKKIKASTSKISSSLEEIKRLKMAYQKSLDHYYKSAKDIETLIRLKDNANSEVSLSTDEKDDKSVRTLSSILSKTYSGKEDPKEKCRNMLSTFDSEELQLVASYKKVNNAQTELRAELARNLDEFYEIESTRQLAVKDGANNYMVSTKLLVDRLVELVNTISSNFQNIESSSDLNDLCRIIDLSFDVNGGMNNSNNALSTATAVSQGGSVSDEPRSRSSSDGSISSVLSTSSVPEHLSMPCQPAVPNSQDVISLAQSTSESLYKVIEMIGRSEKMTDGLSNFSKICGKMFTFFSEILQTEKTCSISTQKSLEKNGFANKLPNSKTSSINQAVISCYDAISIESPTLKVTWDSIVKCYMGFSDFHLKSADFILEKMLGQLDIFVKRLDACRKELLDKIIICNEKIKVLKAQNATQTQKLIKTTDFIKERKSTVRKIKEQLAIESTNTNTTSNIVDTGGNRESDLGLTNNEGNQAIPVTSDDSGEATKQTAAATAEKKSRRASFMEGIKGVGNFLQTSQMSAIVTAAIRNETPQERMHRIELQIEELIVQENSERTTLQQSITSLNSTCDTFAQEIAACWTSSNEVLKHVYNSFRIIWLSYSTHQSESVDIMKQITQDIRHNFDTITLSTDTEYFLKTIEISADKQNSPNDDLLSQGLSELPIFEPYKSEIIDEQRRVFQTNQEASTTVNSSFSNNSSSAMEGGLSTSPPVKVDNYLNENNISNNNTSKAQIGNPDTSARPAPLSTSPPIATKAFPNIPTKDSDDESEDSCESDGNSDFNISNSVPISLANLKTTSSTTTSSSTAGNNSASSNIATAKSGKVSSPTPSKEENRLKIFGLPSSHKILETYSCAFYPKNVYNTSKSKIILSHGTMYITQYFLAFENMSGFPEIRVLLPLDDFDKIERSNTVMFVPNAIQVTLNSDKEEYFFGSFVEREQCFSLLNQLSQAAKRLVEINVMSQQCDSNKNLVLGIQYPPKLVTASSSASTLSSVASSKDSIVKSSPDSIGSNSNKGSEENSPLSDSDISNVSSIQSDASSKSLKPSSISSTETITSATSSDRGSESKETSEQTRGVNIQIAASPPPQALPELDDSNDGIIHNSIYEKSGIIQIGEVKLENATTNELFKSYFLYGSGIRDFLHSEGDLDIKFGLWSPLKDPKVVEDISKIPFTHMRNFSYSHPRTSMLMFGPKNAPGQQMQYLYLPNKQNRTFEGPEDLKNINPTRGVVLTVTQFDGIPMADVFKVCHYWNFDEDTKLKRVTVRIGINIYYVKSTLLKSQILAGTKEELTLQVKKWEAFITSRIKQYQNHVISLSAPKKSENGSNSLNQAAPSNSSEPSVDAVDSSFNPPSENPTLPSTVNESHSNGSKNASSEGPRKVSLLFGLVEVPLPAEDVNIVYILIGLVFLILIQFFRNRRLANKLYALDNKLEDIHTIVSNQKLLIEEFLRSTKN